MYCFSWRTMITDLNIVLGCMTFYSKSIIKLLLLLWLLFCYMEITFTFDYHYYIYNVHCIWRILYVLNLITWYSRNMLREQSKHSIVTRSAVTHLYTREVLVWNVLMLFRLTPSISSCLDLHCAFPTYLFCEAVLCHWRWQACYCFFAVLIPFLWACKCNRLPFSNWLANHSVHVLFLGFISVHGYYTCICCVWIVWIKCFFCCARVGNSDVYSTAISLSVFHSLPLSLCGLSTPYIS